MKVGMYAELCEDCGYPFDADDEAIFDEEAGLWFCSQPCASRAYRARARRRSEDDHVDRAEAAMLRRGGDPSW